MLPYLFKTISLKTENRATDHQIMINDNNNDNIVIQPLPIGCFFDLLFKLQRMRPTPRSLSSKLSSYISFIADASRSYKIMGLSLLCPLLFIWPTQDLPCPSEVIIYSVFLSFQGGECRRQKKKKKKKDSQRGLTTNPFSLKRLRNITPSILMYKVFFTF